MTTVVLLGTLDTKEHEYKFVMDCLHEAGVESIMVDFGVLIDPEFQPDIGAQEVARQGGEELRDLRSSTERSDTRANALATMTKGLIKILKQLREENRCDAVFGLGGSGGSSVISEAMQSLPIGVPKLLLSTMASGNVGGYIGTKDIAIMYSVTDIAGLNRVSRPILRNAAYGIAGMAKGVSAAEVESKPLISITMFGITTTGVLRIVEKLEENGFETIVFHANGSSRAMEELIDEGLINGIIDYTLSELTDYTLGGAFHAGPNRLEAAGRQGIPQLVVPGGIEVLNFGPRETVPDKYDQPERKLIIHNPYVCAVRINQQESVQLGTLVAEKLNRAKGPTAVIVPLNGLDKYEAPPDGPWIDKEKDRALFNALRLNLRPDIAYTEIDDYINNHEFADAIVEAFVELWKEHQKEKGILGEPGD
jgi:uncharacterized protein (UPF0261 family)